LPISAKLTDADVEDVIAAVKKCLTLGKAKHPVLATSAKTTD
jgi:hypothetical protein